jgi:hypothetical protein
MKYLLSNNNDVILETFRVFANLSRHQSIRNYLINKKGYKLFNFFLKFMINIIFFF